MNSDGPLITASSSLADRDLAAWLTLLKAILPGGDGSVAQATVDGQEIFTVSVTWGEHSDSRTFTTEARI
jgi:hypothetical protein